MSLVHHTKNKGDLGVAKAHADLVEQAFLVLFPATEHAPFDLVAYKDGAYLRVQVKYRALRHGSVTVEFRSSWADRHGTHGVAMDKTEVDAVCIYCPDTDECFYLRPMEHGQQVTLRVTPSRNGQVLGVNAASAFRRLG